MVMKILYVITKSNWGGAQRHVYDLATAMKAKGHEVMVALGGEGMLKQRLDAAGIYTFSISSMGRDVSVTKDTGAFRAIYTIIKNKRPDVLHLHSTKAVFLGALAGRLLRTKTIVATVHGWAFNEPRPFYERLIIATFAWKSMILAHTTIVISEKDYKQALLFPGVKKKVAYIPLGIASPTFVSVDGAKQHIARLLNVDTSKRLMIAAIAELHDNKGLTYLIHAMKAVAERHSQVLCAIIGDGEEKPALSALIAELKLENHVYLAGFIDQAAEYLKAFNVFVLPSLKEGLPYVLLEAGSASLPVVATTVGGIPDIVEDMKSGILIQPKNSRELAHAITFMIEHPEERRRFGNALKERISAKFGVEKMLVSVESLYASNSK
jgi:glycosyltransferase involved in cell wall biosynthesis